MTHQVQGEWSCPSCGAAAATRFCGGCGEERPTGHHLDLRHLAGELLENFAHFDGRLLRSLRTLVAAPGELTRAYVAGKRKPFVGPIQLFLVVNVLFFAVQSLTGMSIFSRQLSALLDGAEPGGFFARRVAARLARTGATLADYAPRYDAAEHTHAKTWVILMVPLVALCTWILCRRARGAVPHVVFALHFLAFQMLAFAGLFVLASLVWRLVLRANPAAEWGPFDRVLSLGELASVGLCALFALRRAFGGSWGANLVRAGLLAAAAPWILWIYRAALFAITLGTT